jgi:HAD superfamily hydrolase (TIGR01509 family)
MRGIDDEVIIGQLEAQARAIMTEKLHPQALIVPGLPAFLNTAKQAGLKIAIVSSALHQRIVDDVTSVDLIQYIDTIVGVDDVTCRKPHPEPYQKALAILNLQPTETIAFEDSPPGVESAWLADLPVVGLLTNFPAADLGKAQLLIRDYTEVTMEGLQQLC